MFDYIVIADQRRTVSLSNDIHPAGEVGPVNRIPAFPLTTTAV